MSIQTMRTHNTAAIAAITTALAAAPALSSIVEYTDFGAWSSAVGTFTTLDFTDLAHGEVVDTQYAALGVTFGGTAAGWHQAQTFPLDGHGILNFPIDASLAIEATFAAPMTEVAVHGGVSGGYFLLLYSGQDLVHMGFGDLSVPFLGVNSTQPFDRVRVVGLLGPTRMDNFYFGLPIPAPAGAVLFGLVGAAAGRRRRGR